MIVFLELYLQSLLVRRPDHSLTETRAADWTSVNLRSKSRNVDCEQSIWLAALLARLFLDADQRYWPPQKTRTGNTRRGLTRDRLLTPRTTATACLSCFPIPPAPVPALQGSVRRLRGRPPSPNPVPREKPSPSLRNL